MKCNENIVIIGKNIILVPYKKHHVEKYHKWMSSPELLEKTASEPLTLEAEYNMQQSWWLDDDKCTFIILNKNFYENGPDDVGEKEINTMIGDVNLYLNNVDDRQEAEVELMIAEVGMRRKGFGQEAAKMMMYYGNKMLGLNKYLVKIGSNNKSSINLFMKLGFKLASYSEVFQESTYILHCENEAFKDSIYNEVESYAMLGKYDTLDSCVK